MSATLSFAIDRDTVFQNGSQPRSGHTANVLVSVKRELSERFRNRVDVLDHGLPHLERRVFGELSDARVGQVWMGCDSLTHVDTRIENHPQQ